MSVEDLSAERIAELLALCEKATPGPWTRAHAQVEEPRGAVASMEWGDGLMEKEAVSNAALIAAARTALPAALNEIERLRAYLRAISKQRLSTEISKEDRKSGDFEDAYDTMIGIARAAQAGELDG